MGSPSLVVLHRVVVDVVDVVVLMLVVVLVVFAVLVLVAVVFLFADVHDNGFTLFGGDGGFYIMMYMMYMMYMAMASPSFVVMVVFIS
jgi:hypothetical protein